MELHSGNVWHNVALETSSHQEAYGCQSSLGAALICRGGFVLPIAQKREANVRVWKLLCSEQTGVLVVP